MIGNRQHAPVRERAMSLYTEQLARVDGPARLRVLSGHLWLTLDGQPADHVLAPGDRFDLDRGACALVQAIFAPASAVVAEEDEEEAVSAWMRRGEQTLRVLTQRLARGSA